MSTSGFMLDTCAVNRIHDGTVFAGEWTLRGPTYITDIQLQEIIQTPDAMRRSALCSTLLSLGCNIIRPDLLISGDRSSRLAYDYGFECELDPRSDQLAFGRRVPRMMQSLPGGSNRIENRFRDAFIAQTAAINQLTLVTADRRLSKVSASFGVAVELIQ